MESNPNNYKTLVLAVVHHAVERYIDDYIDSLKSQKDSFFDLLILNDNLDKNIRSKFNYDLNLINIERKLTPAEIRYMGITYGIKHNYKYLIFSDIDDYFSDNRVEFSKKTLKNFNFVFNEINLITHDKKLIESNMLSKLNVKPIYSTYHDIIDKNIFGLSNTAVNLDKIKEIYIPKEIIAVDWWIFTLLLLKKNEGGFIKECITYYRQTNDNLTGMAKPLNQKRLFLGIKVKKTHYENIIRFCEKNRFTEAIYIYKQQLKNILEMSSKIENKDFCKKYIYLINKNIENIYRGWWSDILTLDQWSNYA